MKHTMEKILAFLLMLISPRTYTVINGEVWVKEPGSSPERLTEHLQQEHNIVLEEKDSNAKEKEQ